MKVSLGTQIVGSTVLVVAGVMIVLIAGTQAVLEVTARRDIDRALEVRISAARTLLDQSGRVTGVDVEPVTRVYDAWGRAIAGVVERDLFGRAERSRHASSPTGGPGESRRRTPSI